MRAIIVGRDIDVIKPLTDMLTEAGFEPIVVENGAGVRSWLKKGDVQFLLAESSLLLDQALAGEVHKRCPLARLVALASRPNLLDMVDAISGGLADYYPRRPEYFGDIVRMMSGERKRLMRWQHTLLSPLYFRGPADDGAPAPSDEDGLRAKDGAEQVEETSAIGEFLE